jgi:hypothetical protein
MSKNMVPVDRIIRLVLGVVAIVAAFAGWVTGAWLWVAWVAGVVLMITSIVGFCPAYTLLRRGARPAKAG